MQRVIDVILASLAIVVLTPLLLPLMIVLRFTGEGEVFYRQSRIGMDGKIFKIYKFATMVKDSSKIGSGTLTMKDDPRVLPIGGVLRKTKINEIPQLLNILVGDMSIVGPRPALHNQHELISKRAALGIDQLRPGITGWAQINGRDDISLQDKLNFDQEYLVRRSLFFDLKIILLTLVAVVRSRGVSH